MARRRSRRTEREYSQTRPRRKPLYISQRLDLVPPLPSYRKRQALTLRSEVKPTVVTAPPKPHKARRQLVARRRRCVHVSPKQMRFGSGGSSPITPARRRPKQIKRASIVVNRLKEIACR